jgi:hypothetical protein
MHYDKTENSFNVKRAYLFSIIISAVLFASIIFKSESIKKVSDNLIPSKSSLLAKTREGWPDGGFTFTSSRPEAIRKIDEIRSAEFIEKKDCFLLTTFSGASRGISIMSESFTSMTGEVFKLKLNFEKINQINL